MKKLPRDIKADELIKKLRRKFGYVITKQTGSHIRLTTQSNGEHHLTVANHSPLKLGSLSSILNDVAAHFNKTKFQIAEELF